MRITEILYNSFKSNGRIVTETHAIKSNLDSMKITFVPLKYRLELYETDILGVPKHLHY